MSTYLVTTAEERTWPNKGRVVFLGEWCKKYDRMSEWLELDSITARPYAIQPNEKECINFSNQFNQYNSIIKSLKYDDMI